MIVRSADDSADLSTYLGKYCVAEHIPFGLDRYIGSAEGSTSSRALAVANICCLQPVFTVKG